GAGDLTSNLYRMRGVAADSRPPSRKDAATGSRMDAARGGRTDAAQNESQRERESLERESLSLEERELVDEVLEVFKYHHEAHSVTEAERRTWERAAIDLVLNADATAEDVHRCYVEWYSRWDYHPTPKAIAHNWSTLMESTRRELEATGAWDRSDLVDLDDEG